MERIVEKSKYQTKLIVDKNVDFFLHIFSHLNVKSVASNYDEIYIQKITKIKCESNSTLLTKLNDIINENFVYLSFMPVYWKSSESIFSALDYLVTGNKELIKNFSQIQKYLLQHLQSFINTKKDKSDLLLFNKILISEFNGFYSNYWDLHKQNFAEKLSLFKKTWESKENSLTIDFFKKQKKDEFKIYLSECMLKNGRGMQINNTSVNAITKLPENKDEVFYSYLISIHEMLHQVIDNLTKSVLEIDYNQRSLNTDDERFKVHMAFENSVIYTQFLLAKKTSPEFLMKFLSEMKISNSEEFIKKINFNNKMKEKLDYLIL